MTDNPIWHAAKPIVLNSILYIDAILQDKGLQITNPYLVQQHKSMQTVLNYMQPDYKQRREQLEAMLRVMFKILNSDPYYHAMFQQMLINLKTTPVETEKAYEWTTEQTTHHQRHPSQQ